MKKRLDKYAKFQLISDHTPLQTLCNLSKKYQQTLYIKRDDLTGVGVGGNKVRKLEYIVGDAIQKGATTLVTGGGVQSNHAAMTAIVAKRAGMKCHLALADAVPMKSEHYHQGGNAFIDQLMATSVRRFEKGKTSNQCIAELSDIVEKSDHAAPYPVPMGGSNALGCLGYVQAAFELIEQLKAKNITLASIVVASGSAGTQAGLIVGFAMAKIDIRVLGVSVLHPKEVLQKMIQELCEQTASLLAISEADWKSKVFVDDSYIGAGYGLPASSTWQAIDALVTSESIICDPVYTGKALEGWLHYLENDKELLGETSLFWHTGGFSGLFGYA